jgi:hypothetical protein
MTKDRLQLVLSIASLVVSVLTFTWVQLHAASDKADAEARRYLAFYKLGEGIYYASTLSKQLLDASPHTDGDRDKLKAGRDRWMILLQSSIYTQGLQIDLGKIWLDGDTGRTMNAVGELIQQSKGARTYTAYDLGRKYGELWSSAIAVWANTETDTKCNSVYDEKMQHLREDLKKVGESPSGECETLFLRGTIGNANAINYEIGQLGGKKLIPLHPTTLDEAKVGMSSAISALIDGWSR